MRICIYGAGAIGGHVAARLARGGAEVSVIARGPQLAAIRAEGLRVETKQDGVLHCRPRASDDPRAIGPQDAVIVTVKAPALASVAAGIGKLLGPETPVAFVMNGVPWWYGGEGLEDLDPGGALHAAVGLARTLGGVVYSAATVTSPGVIRAEAEDGRVILGELDGRMTPRVQALADAIAAGGMGAQAVPDIRQAVWAKLLGNLMTGPLCVLARSPIDVAFRDPAVREAATRAGEEVAAVAAALGFDLGGAIPPRVARSAGLAHKPSILQDLEAGRPMEVEVLWRAPLAIAARAGVPTPTLDLLVALATQAVTAAGLCRGDA